MESRVEQTRWQSILRGVLVSLALTVLLFGALIGSARLWRSIQARFVPVLSLAGRRAVIGGINLWPILGALRQLLARALVWSVAGFLVYGWLALVLEQFPYTEPWGDTLGGFVVRMLSGFFWGVLASVPDLFAVAVILALAHAFARGVGAYFLEVERGNVKVSWLAEETARATRQLLTILTWVFAVVVAYPYIPGSDTDAFKGVTVFLGLMISLGSAGLVNQIMSGLTVIYSHAYRRGDYVRIGAHEGRVHQIGLLATKLTTPAGEIVSVPNAVVTANTAVDYSPSEPGAPELLTSAVTIGYDAPWRQVHALLQLAAERTPGLVRDPAPFVLQRALSDFYVEYQLVARLAWREDRPAALSRLLGEIQDAFNQHGVQIMSPHFTTQPQERVVVPRGAWYSPPAAGG
jgi:small-conductance mechanosensitive channel